MTGYPEPCVGLVFIYTLSDPRTAEVRWVGKAESPERRFRFHWREVEDANPRKWAWLRELEAAGLRPVMRVVDIAPVGEWREREAKWIGFFGGRGRLLNIIGGERQRTRQRQAVGEARILCRFDLTRTAYRLLDSLEAQTGLSHRNLMELAIREFAGGRGMKPPPLQLPAEKEPSDAV